MANLNAVFVPASIQLELSPPGKSSNILYSNDERMEILSSIKEIDEIVIYTFSDEMIDKIDFDILAVGTDQTNPSFQNCFAWCKENKKSVLVVPRTPNICSSDIKDRIAQEK